jgi:alpha-galactosidase
VGATATTLWGTEETPGADWWLGYGDEVTVFNRYAALLAQRLGHRDTKAGRVWSTWYSFYEGIDQDLIATLVPQVATLPFDVFQIDDGWERIVGDWEPNDRFPAGLTHTTDQIRAAGMRAGLWVAPFIARPEAPVVRDHPDWLLRDPAGGPLVAGYNWGGPYFGLDTTLPVVQDYLRQFMGQIHDWGFTYLKLDFVYAAALSAVRSQDVEREQAYHDAMALIRDTVGDDTYILGSGTPMLASAGICDGVRVGPDVGAFWDNAERPRDPSGLSAKNALAASIHRYWLRALYQTDPDATYFRRRRSLLDEDQRQLIQDLATVLGFKSTSDPLTWLTGPEQDELKTWLEATETVTQQSRYRFTIDDRPVDFGPWLGDYTPSPSTVVI